MSNIFKEISIDDLELDIENPRIPVTINKHNETEVLNWMVDDATLMDLMTSIIENGFFQGEPIIVLENTNNQKYTVIEGNRRLSAIKLLRDPKLQTVSPISIKDLSDASKQKNNLPSKIWCYVVSSRNQVANYLGFRHVTGVKSWPLISKARYLFEMFQKRKPFHVNVYRSLANEIGSKGAYVKRLLIAYQAFEKIKQGRFEFGIKDFNEENFSLSRIADVFRQSNVVEYVKLDDSSEFPLENVNEENFKQLIKWLYSVRDNGSTIVGDNRNFGKLNKILEFEISLNHLLKTGNLEEAYELTNSGENDFHSLLKDILFNSRSAIETLKKSNNIDRISDNLISEIEENIVLLYREARRKERAE